MVFTFLEILRIFPVRHHSFLINWEQNQELLLRRTHPAITGFHTLERGHMALAIGTNSQENTRIIEKSDQLASSVYLLFLEIDMEYARKIFLFI